MTPKWEDRLYRLFIELAAQTNLQIIVFSVWFPPLAVTTW